MRRAWSVLVVIVVGVASCVCRSMAETQDAVFPSAQERSSFLEELRAAHPVRMSTRQEAGSALYSPLRSQTMLFFRAMDMDRDKLLSKEDVMAAPQVLAAQIPGVSTDEFASFVEEADLDGDHKLNINELLSAFEQGLQGTEMVETAETATRASRRGFIGGVISGVKNFVGKKISQLSHKFSGKIDTKEDSCIMCQYIVERCEVNVHQSGVIGAPSSMHGHGPLDAMSYLEMQSQVTASTSHAQPFEAQAATIIGQNRQQTRYNRLVERQKYNEIYRIVDVTLDDVCEQGMPNNLYGYCKEIYQTQADVVDGLRYQYRADDICYRIGMCSKNSYITQGIHSRYKDVHGGGGGGGNPGATFPRL